MEVLKKRKSLMLTEKQSEKLKQFIKKHAALIDASAALGIERYKLERLLWKGSASPETVNKVIAVIDAE